MSVNPMAMFGGATSGAKLGALTGNPWLTALGAIGGAAGGAMEEKPGGGPTIGGQSGTPAPQINVESFAPGTFGPGALQPQFGGQANDMNPMIRDFMLKQLQGR